MKIRPHIYCITVISFLLTACIQDKHIPRWDELASGIWQVSVGTPEKLNLLSELDLHPKWDAIQAMEDAELPIDPQEIRFQLTDGKTYLRFPLDKDEKIFWIGPEL